MNIDNDTIVIILNEKKLNSKSKLTFEDIQNENNINNLNQNIIEMLIFNDPCKLIKVIIN